MKSSLRNVILAYSRYDPSIKFDEHTKGVAQIVAVILYHTQGDEVTSFWILVSLVENYDMRQLYQVGIPGHILFGEVLTSLVEQYLPSIGDCLKTRKITHSDFFGKDGESPSWVSSLNAGIIPVEVMDQFIGHFLRHGWAYYFGLYLAFLDSL